VETVIACHAREFAQHGHAVTILAGRGDDHGGLTGVGTVILPDLDSQYPDNLLIARALEQGRLLPEFDSMLVRLVDCLSPILAQSDVIVAHNVFNFHYNLPLVAALHLMLDRGIFPRMIAWCHDVSRYVNPTSGAELRFGFPWDLLRAYRPEVTYVAVSLHRQHALAGILRCPPERIRVISNGVDAETLLGLSDLMRQLVQEFELFEADLIVLMPVRITRAKNIEYALRTIAALKALGLYPRLVVTGPPDPHAPDSQAYWSELLALRCELGLEREAIFLYKGTSHRPGHMTIDAPVVAELYRVCDLVLMPSLREGFGIPILEGGLVGKPVFCTAIPVLDEIGAEFVYRIEADEPPDHLAARIEAWARQDVNLRLRRRVRQAYTWPAIFRRRIQPLIASTVPPSEQKT